MSNIKKSDKNDTKNVKKKESAPFMQGDQDSICPGGFFIVVLVLSLIGLLIYLSANSPME